MYIQTSDGKSIVDSNFVERFCIVEKPDACLIVASYSADRAVTIGRYADSKEAKAAFSELLNNLVGDGGAYAFTMPDSVLFWGEKWKRDARTKRKGGSQRRTGEMEKREGRVLCRHMTSYGECTMMEEPCVQDPCSLEEPEEWVPVVRCAACRHRTEPKCNKADYAARGIAKCGCTKSPCSGRLVYLTDFCSYGERKPE